MTRSIDRSIVTSAAQIRWLPNLTKTKYLGINLTYVPPGDGNSLEVSLSGRLTAPMTGTFPIVNADSSAGFNGTYSILGEIYGSLGGGTFTITKFDTMNNLVSGSFQMVVAARTPKRDPNNRKTIVGSFSDVVITSRQFGQGSLAATIFNKPFQSVDQFGTNLDAYIFPGKTVLFIDAEGQTDSGTVSLSISINTPQLGTFAFGSNATPGSANCSFSTRNGIYSTSGRSNCGQLTITQFDALHHRLSGTFTATPGRSTTDAGIAITNGVIDNVTWVQE
jgi:hypothetical protein